MKTASQALMEAAAHFEEVMRGYRKGSPGSECYELAAEWCINKAKQEECNAVIETMNIQRDLERA